MWSLESTACYITAVVTQPCDYTQHGLGLLIKEPLVGSSSSIHKKETLFELVESSSTNKPRKKKDGPEAKKHSPLIPFSETTPEKNTGLSGKKPPKTYKLCFLVKKVMFTSIVSHQNAL